MGEAREWVRPGSGQGLVEWEWPEGGQGLLVVVPKKILGVAGAWPVDLTDVPPG